MLVWTTCFSIFTAMNPEAWL